MFEKYDRAVKMYLNNMRQNELSPASVESYSRTFRYFRENMERNGYMEPCPAAVMDFRASLGVSVTSANLYMTHLKLLDAFCTELKLCEPFFTASAMPPQRKVTNEKNKEYEHVLTQEQYIELITAEKPNYGRKPHTWLREQAEVAVFLTSGLRNSELRAITPDDLDWENGTIHARQTKGDKPRYVAFPETAQNAVRAYLNSELRPAYAGENEPLFGLVGRKSKEWHGFSVSQLSELIYNYVKSVIGEDDACRTHALRHLYASVMLEQGVRLEFISETLGHSNLSTTKIYANRLTKSAPAAEIANIADVLVNRSKISIA